MNLSSIPEFLLAGQFLELSQLLDGDFNGDKYVNDILFRCSNLEKIMRLEEDIVRYYAFPNVCEDEKSDLKAQTFRNCGNDYYSDHNYFEALRHYTLSLANAKSNKMIALIYGNRSESLFSLEMYEECLIDIERALEHGYPTCSKPKLIARRDEAANLLQPTIKPYEDIPVIPDSEKNILIGCASNAVRIDEDQVYGRKIVATRTIEPGELIAVEKPYAAVILEDVTIHCHHCMRLCYNPIPCTKCTMALFCGEECREEANCSYHPFECPLLLTLEKYPIPKQERLVLRTAILAKAELMTALSHGFYQVDFYRSDRYKEIHCLHASRVTPSNSMTYFSKLVIATMFCHLLKIRVNFFRSKSEEAAFKKEIVRITTLQPKTIAEYYAGQDRNYATGFYAFFSLFNHSCWPNTYNINYGSTQAIRTTRRITKGEQLFVSYGPHYRLHSKFVREKFLYQSYLFCCKCIACEEDWKLETLLSEDDKDMIGEYRNLILKSKDRDVLKNILSELLKKLKNIQSGEFTGTGLAIEQLISLCYVLLGTVRKV